MQSVSLRYIRQQEERFAVLNNTATAWGSASKALHWIGAALIVIHVVGALYHLWLKRDAVIIVEINKGNIDARLHTLQP